MEELIWYSIPGAVYLLVLVLIAPKDITGPEVAAVIGGTPIVGFLIHQTWRTIFEASGGFESKCRSVIKTIREEYGLGCDSATAFQIWEITFYGDGFPSSFREHDRGAWHYIMSFWAVSLAAILGIATLFLSECLGKSPPRPLLWSLILIVIAAVLGAKGYLTFRSIRRQEVAIFKRHRSLFDSTKDALVSPAMPSADEKT